MYGSSTTSIASSEARFDELKTEFTSHVTQNTDSRVVAIHGLAGFAKRIMSPCRHVLFDANNVDGDPTHPTRSAAVITYGRRMSEYGDWTVSQIRSAESTAEYVQHARGDWNSHVENFGSQVGAQWKNTSSRRRSCAARTVRREHRGCIPQRRGDADCGFAK